MNDAELRQENTRLLNRLRDKYLHPTRYFFNSCFKKIASLPKTIVPSQEFTLMLAPMLILLNFNYNSPNFSWKTFLFRTVAYYAFSFYALTCYGEKDADIARLNTIIRYKRKDIKVINGEFVDMSADTVCFNCVSHDHESSKIYQIKCGHYLCIKCLCLCINREVNNCIAPDCGTHLFIKMDSILNVYNKHSGYYLSDWV